MTTNTSAYGDDPVSVLDPAELDRDTLPGDTHTRKSSTTGSTEDNCSKVTTDMSAYGDDPMGVLDPAKLDRDMPCGDTHMCKSPTTENIEDNRDEAMADIQVESASPTSVPAPAHQDRDTHSRESPTAPGSMPQGITDRDNHMNTSGDAPTENTPDSAKLNRGWPGVAKRRDLPSACVDVPPQETEIPGDASDSAELNPDDTHGRTGSWRTATIKEPAVSPPPFPDRTICEVEMFSDTKSERTNLVLEATVNGYSVPALIDTAAQVSVVSEEFFRTLHPAPPLSGKVWLGGASKGNKFLASKATNMSIGLGNTQHLHDLVVAPINDPFILGIDFMKRVGLKIDLENDTIIIRGETLPAVGPPARDQTSDIKKVALLEDITFPPFSMVRCPATLGESGKGLALAVITPLNNGGLTMPEVLVTAGATIPILVMNTTANPMSLSAGHVVGTASSIEEVLEEPRSCMQVRKLEPCSDTSPADKGRLPSHLTDLFTRSCTHLSEAESAVLANLLTEYQDVFAKDDLDLGKFSPIKHRIDVGDAKPVRQGIRRTPIGFEGEEKRHLDDMLEKGVIRPSASEWASAPVLVRKKCGAVRYCIDYRALNAVSKKDAFPLPLIESCMDALSGTNFLSTLDLASGYWQIEVAEEDKPKTAFITRYGLFEHERMPFGLCNAPATFQRAMQLVLHGLLWSDCLAYLDDVVVLGKNFSDHAAKLQVILGRFRKYNLKLKPKKCVLFQTEVRFLGHVVSGEGIAVNPDNIKTVKTWPIPTTVKEVEAFLGFVNYHRQHISHLADLTAPLNILTGPKAHFSWGDDKEEAFRKIKDALVSSAVLSYPDPNPASTFILDTDASDRGLGAELLQVQDGKERVISYGSRVLTPAQRRYCTTRKELLAIITFTRQYRHYLLGRHFKVRTDHSSLTWLLGFRNPEGQLARWLEELGQYSMEVIHRPGKNHTNADGLSRIPDTLHNCDCYRAGSDPTLLPCGGCKYCRRAHSQWTRFDDDVDDVVPLAVRSVTVMPKLEDEKSKCQTSTNWVDNYSPAELRQLQLDDHDLAEVHRFYDQRDSEDSPDLALSSPAVKHWWLCRKMLHRVNGVMYYRWADEQDSQPLFMVPTSLKGEMLEHAHDTVSGGHLGQKKTLAKLQQRCIWHGMSRDSKLYCRSCSTCSLNKKANIKPRARLGSHHAGVPMERVHMDILGPLTPSSRGNVYILVIVCQFTKWIEVFPLPSQSAEEVARAAFDGFISRFGCPLQIHTDQGRNFDGNLFRAFCRLLQITKTRTTPYRPCANGQVERYNRILLQMIRCFLQGGQKNWDEHLPALAGSIRSMVNRQTGFTPNMMMLGREVLQPVDLLLGTPEGQRPISTPAPYLQRLVDRLRHIHNMARSHLRTTQVRQKRDYDLRLVEHSYEVGDLVYKLNSATLVGQSNKLKQPWKGPYLITEVLSPVLYRIRDRRGESVIHHDRLSRCEDRIIPLWMRRMRHQFLDLDTTIAYDAAELDEEEEESLDLPGLFDQTSGPQKQVASTPHQRSNSGGKENVLPDSAELDQADPSPFDLSGDDHVQDTLAPTSLGRRRRRPRKLDGYLVY